MKLIFTVLYICFLSCTAIAQDFGFTYDHNAILVSDMDKSTAFYSNVLGLKEVPLPDLDPKVRRWYSLGGPHQLHLIKMENDGVKLHKAIHFALRIREMDAFIRQLEEMEITYYNWEGEAGKVKLRADNVRQIYVKDPDGYWIEINEAL